MLGTTPSPESKTGTKRKIEDDDDSLRDSLSGSPPAKKVALSA